MISFFFQGLFKNYERKRNKKFISGFSDIFENSFIPKLPNIKNRRKFQEHAEIRESSDQCVNFKESCYIYFLYQRQVILNDALNSWK